MSSLPGNSPVRRWFSTFGISLAMLLAASLGYSADVDLGLETATAKTLPVVLSGIPVGNRIPHPLPALCVNGRYPGAKRSLACVAARSPTVLVFAREPNAAVVRLIRTLEEVAVKNDRLFSFVVFSTDDETNLLEKQL